MLTEHFLNSTMVHPSFSAPSGRGDAQTDSDIASIPAFGLHTRVSMNILSSRPAAAHLLQISVRKHQRDQRQTSDVLSSDRELAYVLARRHSADATLIILQNIHRFLVDCTNGRTYATVLCPSVRLSVCNVCIVAKRCVLPKW